MGSNKIEFVSYAYRFSMYFITLSLVTGKHQVTSVYTFTVSGSAWPIAANNKFAFSSLKEKQSVSVSSASFSLFVDLFFSRLIQIPKDSHFWFW